MKKSKNDEYVVLTICGDMVITNRAKEDVQKNINILSDKTRFLFDNSDKAETILRIPKNHNLIDINHPDIQSLSWFSNGYFNLKENENSNVVKFASLNDQIQIQSDDYDEYGERLVKASS